MSHFSIRSSTRFDFLVSAVWRFCFSSVSCVLTSIFLVLNFVFRFDSSIDTSACENGPFFFFVSFRLFHWPSFSENEITGLMISKKVKNQPRAASKLERFLFFFSRTEKSAGWMDFFNPLQHLRSGTVS
jgi:hypothetical protein